MRKVVGYIMAIAIATSVYVNGIRFRCLNRKSERIADRLANVNMELSLASLEARRKMVKCIDYEISVMKKYGRSFPKIMERMETNKEIRQGLIESIQNEAVFVDNLTDLIQQLKEAEEAT